MRSEPEENTLNKETPSEKKRPLHTKRIRITAIVAACVCLTACGIGAFFLLGDGQKNDTTEENGVSPNILSPLPSQEARHAPEELSEVFPDQVNSFLAGSSETEPEHGGYAHSHATLEEHVEPMLKEMPVASMGCIACKSTDFNALYAEKSKDAFSESPVAYDGETDYFDCNICHKDAPGSSLQPGLVFYQLYGSSILPTISTEEAICGQCHNALGQYGRSGAAQFEGDLSDIDPYRYGLDPDSLKKAALEDGIVPQVDEKTGADAYIAQHPDIEIFQGSVHEKLGLTCVSCHMPKRENGEGNTYTSHNASSTPIENEEALEFCLTCHSEQGVKNTDEMKQFILDAEEDLAQLEAATLERLTQLESALAEATETGNTDDSIEQARTLYEDAKWYYTYAHGSAEKPGQKVAHNPSAERTYQEKALSKCEEAIDLLDAATEE